MSKKILKDFDSGDIGEKAFMSVLEKLSIKAVQRAKLQEYDIEFHIGGNVYYAEVKNDIMAESTGNIALEVFNTKRNKLSGVLGTKADIWVHIVCGKIYCCNVKKLREYIDKNKPEKIIESGGDNNAMLLLYRSEQILAATFTELDITSNTKQLLKTLKACL